MGGEWEERRGGGIFKVNSGKYRKDWDQGGHLWNVSHLFHNPSPSFLRPIPFTQFSHPPPLIPSLNTFASNPILPNTSFTTIRPPPFPPQLILYYNPSLPFLYGLFYFLPYIFYSEILCPQYLSCIFKYFIQYPSVLYSVIIP